MKPLQMGIYDNLDTQTQPLFNIDMLSSNIIVFGSHMSGKTNFLKTMLVRMHQNIEPNDMEEVYIIDFGGNLSEYGKLPLVAACFDNSNEENIRRIFFTVENKFKENIKYLKSEQFYDVYNNSVSEKPKHITLIVDNVNSFFADERYIPYQEDLLKYCRNGLSQGLSIVFTANDTSNGISKFLSSFNRKFAFELPAEVYIDIFGIKSGTTMKNSGRGVSIIDGKLWEFQTFLPFENEKLELTSFTKLFSENLYKVVKLQAFGDELNYNNFHEYSIRNVLLEETEQSRDIITVGLDYYEHAPIQVNLREMHSIAIYGKKGYGKSNLTKVLVNAIRRNHPEYLIVLFDDGRKQLEELHIPYSKYSVYMNKIDQLTTFLDVNGYVAKQGNKEFKKMDTPETVFVLQNKMLFQGAGKNLLSIFSRMNASAEENGYYFIYTDVRKSGNNDREVEAYLNNSFSAAFLLDSISEFIVNKGSRSVFGEMDAKELKTVYAKCDLGDGYFYDIESEILTKFKVIKA